jgi:CheY-like chemotaxis protein
MAHPVERQDSWILLIDDDVEFGNVLAAFLKRMGVRLERTATVPDFAAIVRQNLPSVCLIDLNINGLLAGFALVTGLRRKYGSDLPIIVISGNEDPASISHAIECGADDYIVKPIDPQIFNAKVGRFVKLAKTIVEPDFVPAPPGGFPGSLEYSVSFKGLDELGIRVISPHFICKGAPTTFSGAYISKIFPQKQKVLATVLSCERLADGFYLVCYEFAELSADDQNSLRIFLAENRPSENQIV